MQTAAGEWVLAQLPDGSARYEWMPDPQPASPDGGPGVWRFVPGPVDGAGDWGWHPASASVEKATLGVTRLKRRRVLAGVAVVLLGLVVVLTRGGGSPDRPGVSTLSDSQKRATLVATANSYMAALLAGNGAEAAKYLDPRVCTSRDRGDVEKIADLLARQAPGAKATATKVEVSGDDGNVGGYDVSGGTPAAVRDALQAGYTTGGEFSWHLRADKWVFDSEC